VTIIIGKQCLCDDIRKQWCDDIIMERVSEDIISGVYDEIVGKHPEQSL